MSFTDYLVTDDLTVLLGFIGVSVFLLQNLYKPQPLVHPILLGRQSDVGRVRHPAESAVYRNYGTGLMGRVRLLFSLPTGTVISWNSAVPCQTRQGRRSSQRLCQVPIRVTEDTLVNQSK